MQGPDISQLSSPLVTTFKSPGTAISMIGHFN